MRPVRHRGSPKGARHQFQQTPSKTPLPEDTPVSPEVDEQGLVANHMRLSVQSSSKDSGVVMEPEDVATATKGGSPNMDARTLIRMTNLRKRKARRA